MYIYSTIQTFFILNTLYSEHARKGCTTQNTEVVFLSLSTCLTLHSRLPGFVQVYTLRPWVKNR
jgi:hypothetical protein